MDIPWPEHLPTSWIRLTEMNDLNSEVWAQCQEVTPAILAPVAIYRDAVIRLRCCRSTHFLILDSTTNHDQKRTHRHVVSAPTQPEEGDQRGQHS